MRRSQKSKPERVHGLDHVVEPVAQPRQLGVIAGRQLAFEDMQDERWHPTLGQRGCH